MSTAPSNTPPTTQPTSASTGAWHSALTLLRELAQAGFTTGAMKTLSSHDGIAFNVTLKFKGKPLAEVCNEGTGGPDMESPVFHSDAKKNAASQLAYKEAMPLLLALPIVQQFMREFETEVAAYLPEPQRSEEVARIQAIEHFTLTEENIGNLVATVAERHKLIKSIRRKIGTKLAWVTADNDFGVYMLVNWDDTPSNRVRARGRFAKEIDEGQGFVSDLLAGL
jgi:hypothetical protein